MDNFFRLTLILFFAFISSIGAQENLRKDIEKLVQTVNGSVGVGVKHIEVGDTLTVNGDVHFPMQSVYKFHLALAVLSEVDKGKLAIDQKVFIRKEDYLPRTVSQIAEKYPDGNVQLTIEDLLTYTVATSDNNGCDILFGLIGGPEKVDDYFTRTLAVKDLSIVNTEAQMHRDWEAQYNNWTTPRAMSQLLDEFYRKKILSPQSTELLVKIMEGTSTGKKRIKGLLPARTVVAHKTGMGGNSAGVISAVNDVGIVTLPSGEHVAIALFISNPKDSVDELETLMAKISKLVFDYYAPSK